jgi:hypothetical protein
MAATCVQVLVDTENVQSTHFNLASELPPKGGERMDWWIFPLFAEAYYGVQAEAHAWVNVTKKPRDGFIRLLEEDGFLVHAVQAAPGTADSQIVDTAIIAFMKDLEDRDDHVMLVTNDDDYLDQLLALKRRPGRSVEVLGFKHRGLMSSLYEGTIDQLDIELDAQAIRGELPNCPVKAPFGWPRPRRRVPEE